MELSGEAAPLGTLRAPAHTAVPAAHAPPALVAHCAGEHARYAARDRVLPHAHCARGERTRCDASSCAHTSVGGNPLRGGGRRRCGEHAAARGRARQRGWGQATGRCRARSIKGAGLGQHAPVRLIPTLARATGGHAPWSGPGQDPGSGYAGALRVACAAPLLPAPSARRLRGSCAPAELAGAAPTPRCWPTPVCAHGLTPVGSRRTPSPAWSDLCSSALQSLTRSWTRGTATARVRWDGHAQFLPSRVV